MRAKEFVKKIIRRSCDLIFPPPPKKIVFAQIAELAPSKMLDGRTALITGGTSGIGFEIAKAFSKAGATVVITGRTQKKIESSIKQMHQQLGDIESNLYGIEMDVREISSLSNKFQSILKLLGERKIDILVNNAGVEDGNFSSCTEEQFDNVMSTNVKGPFFLSRIVAKYFIKNGINGNILNMSSSSSLRPAKSAYMISKWGMNGFTKGLAKFLTPYGITVNGLAPGPTATPMVMKNSVNNDIAINNPQGRYDKPCEIANMAVFLVSDCGKSIIGDTIFMTGGSGVTTFDDLDYSF